MTQKWGRKSSGDELGEQEREQETESRGILTSCLLELKALDMGRKEPAYFELPTQVITIGSVKVRGRMRARLMCRAADG